MAKGIRIRNGQKTERDYKFHEFIKEMLGKDECYILITGTVGEGHSRTVSNVPADVMENIICEMADSIRNHRAAQNN